jgi:hypothetical protein
VVVVVAVTEIRDRAAVDQQDLAEAVAVAMEMV